MRSYGDYTFGYGLLRATASKGGAMEDWQARAGQRWGELDADDRAGAQRQLGQGAEIGAPPEPPAPAPRSARDELEAFVRARRAEGTRVVLLRLRVPWLTRSHALEMGRKMDALCARAGCDVVDTYGPLEGKMEADDTVSDADAHPSARVHRLYAEVIHEALRPILARLSAPAP